MKIDNLKINGLATESAKGNQVAFTELFGELEPIIKAEAQKAKRHAKGSGLYNVPVEDFVSAFNEAIWQSIKGYDEKASHFMQRLRTYMRYREADVWRSYSFQENGETSYEKARGHSLEEPVSDSEGETTTLGDVVLAEFATRSAEEEIVEVGTILDALEDYRTYKPKYFKVIDLLTNGATNIEIAEAFGENEYNVKIRILVYRAKKDFESFLANHTDYLVH